MKVCPTSSELTNYKEKRATATGFDPNGCGFPSHCGH